MKPTHTLFCLTVLLCTVATNNLQTQQSSTTLTLNKAIAQSLTNNLRLTKLKAHHDSTKAVEQKRTTKRHPNVTAEDDYTRTNHIKEFAIVQPKLNRQVVYPNIPNNFQAQLDLQ